MFNHIRQLLILAFILTLPAGAADTVYLVRHAEKQADGTQNPGLTEVGAKRAQWLAGYFADKGLTAVYSTNYVRTQDTAAPTAKAMGLEVQAYDPRALAAFAETLKAMPGNILVVGHSNTTPILAGLLIGQQYEELDERVYDHIYVVHPNAAGGEARIDFSEPRTPFDPVSGLKDALQARLAMMANVAAYKWNQHLPVEDVAREAAVLEATVARARAEGLPDGYAETVVTAQMAAAKMIQKRLFAAWKDAGAGTIDHVPDLQTELRPRISALTGDLIIELKQAASLLASCAAQESLKQVPANMADDAAAWAEAADGVIAGQPCN